MTHCRRYFIKCSFCSYVYKHQPFLLNFNFTSWIFSGLKNNYDFNKLQSKNYATAFWKFQPFLTFISYFECLTCFQWFHNEKWGIPNNIFISRLGPSPGNLTQRTTSYTTPSFQKLPCSCMCQHIFQFFQFLSWGEGWRR